MEWNDRFMSMLRAAVERYHERPQTSAERFFLPDELELLAEIGYSPEEMHGYVQDYAVLGDPSPGTILLIAAARRSYFITAQRGISGKAKPVKAKDLPADSEEFQGIPYLPRIIRKAEAKLYGILDPSIMYYCAKDRQFLREHGNIHPADFLYLTWNAHADRQKVVAAVLNAMRANAADAGNAPPAAPASDAPVQCELKLD